MKKSLVLPVLIAGQLLSSQAFAQGSGKSVTIFRMSGPQLGVRLEEVDKDIATRLKLKEEKGALVTEVLKDSAAEKAGIQKDDVILRFQGESVLTAAQLSRLVREVPSGRKVDIDLVRNGAPLKVAATLENREWRPESGEFPDMALFNKRLQERLATELPKKFDFAPMDDKGAWTAFRMGRGRLGITYTEIEGQLAHYFKAPRETAILVNSVVAGSAAEKAGIKAGDLMIKIGTTTIVETSDLQEAVRGLEDGTATPVTVWRDGRNVDLSVTVESQRKTQLDTPRKRRPVS